MAFALLYRLYLTDESTQYLIMVAHCRLQSPIIPRLKPWAFSALICKIHSFQIQYQDIEYREEQNDYLEFIAETLVSGKELPRNIIADYEDYYKGTATLWKSGWHGFIKEFRRFINI
jgi:hypothetical protein